MSTLQLPIPAYENRTPFMRGSLRSVFVEGYSENGFRYIKIEEVDPDPEYPEFDLPAYWYAERIVIEGNHKGEFYYIVDRWNRVVLSPNGKVIWELDPDLRPTKPSNLPDTIGFNALIGGQIIPSLPNSWIRKIKRFNNQPLFNSLTGQHIPDSEYDTTALPVGGYEDMMPNYLPEDGD